MTTFSPEDILNASTEGQMATQFAPVPEGEWAAYVEKLEVRSGTSQNGNDWTALDVFWTITEPSVIAELEMDEPKVRQSVFLDFDESGTLAMGKNKNIGLGRLREAVGQNGPGAWSMGQLEGASAIVRVEHREYEGKTFAEVKGVAAA